MRLVWPRPGRITLALLAVAPAAMAYPWRTVPDRWVLGVAVAVLIVLFGWWRGLHFTTIVRRRLALLFGRRSGGVHQLVEQTVYDGVADARTTALLRLLPERDGDLPLPLIASYLDRYGLRSETVRVTSRDTASGRATWVGLTMSAAANLPALRARSEQIPLRETAEVALRRLADHLRENGWAVTTSDIDVPDLLGPQAKERWRAVEDGTTGFVAAYGIAINDALPEILKELWSYPSTEVWTAVEVSAGATLAAACTIRTDEMPKGAAPLPNLISRRGSQVSAIGAISPSSTDALDAPTGPAAVLDALRWPADRVFVGS